MRTDIVPMTGNLPASPLPYGADSAPAGGGRSANPLIRLIAAVRRFWWLILICTLVGGGLGFIATRFMPPKFVVSGTVFLEERGGNAGPVEAAEYLSGAQWIELLKQSNIVEPVVRQQRLYVVGPNPTRTVGTREGPTGPDAVLFEDFDIVPERFVPGEYTLTYAADGRSWELAHLSSGRRIKGAVGDSIGLDLGLMWMPRHRQRWNGETFRFTLLTPREVTNEVIGALGTNMAARGGRFVTVRYDGTDGERAARTLNGVMRRFVIEASALKKQNLTDQARALDSQLFQAEEQLRSTELALQNFGIATATQPRDDAALPPGSQMALNSTFGTYFQQRATIDSLRRERREIVTVVERTRAGDLTTDQMLAIGAVRNSPDLTRVLGDISTAEAQLRELRETKGPEARELLLTEARVRELRTQTLPAYADAVVRRIDEELVSREGRLQTVEREMRDIPTRTITQQRLARELELARATHADIQRRAAIARLQEASSLPDVRILNEAVAPLRPTKNRKSVILTMAIFAGLAAGVGLAFLLDLLDKRFRYADQVTSGLGLSILGVIPEIKRAKGQTPTAEEAAQVVEAFRSVRLNLAHIFPETGPILLTISSPSPGDGKSLISSNLALSFAEAGYRTLLIDGDTRRGEMHRTFGIERRPGLLDFLVGECSVDVAFRPSTHPKLTLMPHGSRHRNAPELLGSKRMHEMIANLKGQYDVILIDSPPLGAGIDPFVLGTVTGNLMLVVRAGATERDLAEAKLAVLDRLPIRLVGAVLNDVRTTMSEYKYYSYSYGYAATDEDEGPVQLPATVGTKDS